MIKLGSANRIKIKVSRLTGLYMSVAILSGCASGFSAGDITEKMVSEVAFPVPEANNKMKLLRSKYIAGAIVLYGQWAVKEHSKGDDQEQYASAILHRTEIVGKQLQKNWLKLNEVGSTGLGPVDHPLYIADVVRLIRVATSPARHRYERDLLSAFTSSDIVGAAKTAVNAMKNLAVVEGFRDHLSKAARGHAIKILDSGTASDSPGTWKAFYENSCSDKSAKVLSSTTPSGLVKGATIWSDELPEYMKTKMCNHGKTALRKDMLAMVRAASEGRIGNLKDVSPVDWKSVDSLWKAGCSRLAALAGKTGYSCGYFN